jgi:hypothetical protein
MEQPTALFQITAMDITGQYFSTRRKNKYINTFLDHFSRYTTDIRIQDQTAETCARLYATQIVTRHGTDKRPRPKFMSRFVSETCKIMGIGRIHTTSFQPWSNGNLGRWHRTLDTGLSHYVKATHTNWDVLLLVARVRFQVLFTARQRDASAQ